ncbi:hypothetical protein Tco_0620631 [Tanacetum coccineum]
MVTNTNVDYADLIWEDFKFQIDSRKISAKKKDLLPFPRFIKLIIKHILSHHNNVSKRLQSNKHGIKLDAVLRNLKFTNKGAKDPIYGMEIPIEMMSEEIKASTDYLNYLAKSMGTQPVKGRGKGLFTKKGVKVVVEKTETVRVPRKKRTDIVIKETGQFEEAVDIVDSEETDDEEDMKKARGASKNDFILQQHPKGPGEGSGMIPEAPDGPSGSSGSSSLESKDEEGFVSTDDKATQEKVDDEKAKDVKDADEQAGEEQPMDEQAKIDQPGKVQAEVSIADSQVEKPASQHINPAEMEIQLMVDVPVRQEDPIIQRPPLVKSNKRKMPRKACPSTSQPFDEASLNEYDHNNKLMKLMMKSKSFNTHPVDKKLYDALMDSLLVDENDMDHQFNDQPSQKKRHHDDQDPPANADKDTKKRKRNDSDA